MNIQKSFPVMLCFFVLTMGASCQLMERPGQHSVLHNMEEDRQTYMFFFDGHPAMLAQFKKSSEYKHFMAAKTDRSLRYWLSKFLSQPPAVTHRNDTTKGKNERAVF